MGRIRTFKPEMLDDANAAGLSDAAYRLFTSAILLADDYGNCRAEPRWLQGQIWWAHRDPPNVAAVLRELADAGLITIYDVREQRYLHIRGWDKHQRVDNAGNPRVPQPNDPEAKEVRREQDVDDEDSRNFAETRGETPPDLRPPIPTSDPDLDLSAGKPAAKPKSRKARLPSDWSPSEAHRAKALDLGVDLAFESEKFRNHHASRGTTFADPDAAFRNWLLNAAVWGHQSRAGPKRRGRGYVQPQTGHGAGIDEHAFDYPAEGT